MDSSSGTIEGRVTIERPIDEVFRFYRDFQNLPRFLGDVVAVDETSPWTSRWTIEGPLGVRLRWTVKVTEERMNEIIRYETAGARALRTSWEIHFSPGPAPAETEVHEVMNAPLGRWGRAVLALFGKFSAREVSSNLRRLKEVVETGRVTDTSHAAKGKFGQP